MDPNQQWMTWSNRIQAHNEHMSGDSTFVTLFQAEQPNEWISNTRPNTDVSMAGYPLEGQGQGTNSEVQTETRSSQRSRSHYLDWDAHKATIKDLYLEKDKSLPETRRIMETEELFVASEKLYKTKFKDWGWQKNLPANTARSMRRIAKRRRDDEGKDTVFLYGERRWDNQRVENTLRRAKTVDTDDDMIYAGTPQGVSYKTPKALGDSPTRAQGETSDENVHVDVVEIVDEDTEDTSDDSPASSARFESSELPLTWQGYSSSDLHDIWRRAREFRDLGGSEDAERMLNLVVLGMRQVLGKTNEDTVKATYQLADLYDTSDRSAKATDVMSKMIDDHVVTLGFENRKTQQVVLDVAEHLNGVGRSTDALGLLSLSRERLQTSMSAHHTHRADSRDGGVYYHQPDLANVLQSIDSNPTRASIDAGLVTTRTSVASRDEAAEGLLWAMISICKDRPDLRIQLLKAEAELLKLLKNLDRASEYPTATDLALDSLDRAWQDFNWDGNEIDDFDFMTAALQLVANALKCGCLLRAKQTFHKIAQKASGLFDSTDDRTVGILINIGIVHQTHLTWDDAAEWFEQALNYSSDWGRKDGIVRSLHNALDRRHFSWVSDEGRAYKTIFGATGVVITPGRLNLG